MPVKKGMLINTKFYSVSPNYEGKSESKVHCFFYVNGGKWRQERHSSQICSGTCHNMRKYVEN
jgi:hypothetical protein